VIQKTEKREYGGILIVLIGICEDSEKMMIDSKEIIWSTGLICDD
jgi:hypothetical protein